MSNSDNLVLLLERDAAAEQDAFVIAANAAFRRASGYTNEQVLGLDTASLFPSPAGLAQAIHAKGTLRSELECRRADGSTFMLGMHLMPAPSRIPGSDCFVILGRDITTAIEARQMQDSTQRLLAKVFTSVDAAVAIVNAAGRIVMTNPQLDSLLGYKSSGLVGLPSLDLVATSARARVLAAIRQQ